MVFALNGVAVGALQLLGMRHLVRLLGKHMMLIAGNVFLAAGMVGVALSRKPAIHFAVSCQQSGVTERSSRSGVF